MKKSGLFLAVFFLIFAGSSFQPVQSQEKTKEEKEREFRMQEEIDAQKKAISEQKKLQELIESEMEVNQENIDKALEKANEQINAADRYKYVYRKFKDGRPVPFEFEGLDNFYEPFVISPGNDRLHGSFFWGDNEKSIWEFSKSIKDKSFSRDYTFDVEPTVKTVIMSVNGDCKSGEIRIKISMPNGKTYSDIAIDEFGNLNWRKSFTMSEEENQDKAGAWKFQIHASDASGFFRISLQTY